MCNRSGHSPIQGLPSGLVRARSANYSRLMKIAVIGPGGIGSTFAFQLARAGHDVTIVARGKRLEQLQRDQAVLTRDGQRVAVRVTAVLDETTPWELVLVTVLASQVDALLPALRASAARQVMFMFNTFEPLGRLRDAVGAARFAFGFPAILASVDGGKLTTQIVARGPLVTTVTDADWAPGLHRGGHRQRRVCGHAELAAHARGVRGSDDGAGASRIPAAGWNLVERSAHFCRGDARGLCPGAAARRSHHPVGDDGGGATAGRRADGAPVDHEPRSGDSQVGCRRSRRTALAHRCHAYGRARRTAGIAGNSAELTTILNARVRLKPPDVRTRQPALASVSTTRWPVDRGTHGPDTLVMCVDDLPHAVRKHTVGWVAGDRPLLGP